MQGIKAFLILNQLKFFKEKKGLLYCRFNDHSLNFSNSIQTTHSEVRDFNVK